MLHNPLPPRLPHTHTHTLRLTYKNSHVLTQSLKPDTAIFSRICLVCLLSSLNRRTQHFPHAGPIQRPRRCCSLCLFLSPAFHLLFLPFLSSTLSFVWLSRITYSLIGVFVFILSTLSYVLLVSNTSPRLSLSLSQLYNNANITSTTSHTLLPYNYCSLFWYIISIVVILS